HGLRTRLPGPRGRSAGRRGRRGGTRPGAGARAGGRDHRRHRRAAAGPPSRRRAGGGRLAGPQHPGRTRGARPRRRPRRLRGGGGGLAAEDARSIPHAISRGAVADYASALFIVCIILIFARIVISFVPRMPSRPWLRAVLDFIPETTDPYLGFFRRFLPPVG